VVVQTGELPPVNDPLLVPLAVEHVRINPADGEPLVIDPAPAVFQEPAGSLFIILYSEGIAGNIENTVLVAELRSWRRFKRFWLDRFHDFHVAVQEKDVTIEGAGAALCARCAPEPDLPDDPPESLYRVLVKAVAFVGQGSDPERNRGEGNRGTFFVYTGVGVGG
jgi:hypothetical protein